MPLLRTLRYRQQRHGSFVRWAMLLAALSVIAAGMPRWVVHAHTADHVPISAVVLQGHMSDGHDVDAGNAAQPTPEKTHLHGHFLGTFSSLLPTITMSFVADALREQRCPPAQVPSPCDGHLATLHRPPIA